MKYDNLNPNTVEWFINENCVRCQKFEALREAWINGDALRPAPDTCMVATMLLYFMLNGIDDVNDAKAVIGVEVSDGGWRKLPTRCKSFSEPTPPTPTIAPNQLRLF